jgi:hypothetical protein
MFAAFNMDFELDHSFGLGMRDEETSAAPEPSLRAWQELAALTDGSGASAADVAAQLGRLSSEALRDAIKSEQKISERKRVLSRLSALASPAQVRTLAVAAADAYDRPLSPVLTKLLNKLAREAEELPQQARVYADHSFRDLFKYIVEAWSASSVDSASAGYDSLFEQDDAEDKSHAGSVAPEPERIIALAFETGATGSVLWTALAQLGEGENGVRRILGMLKNAPADSRAAKTVAQQFANPQRLAMLLHEEPVDFDAVDTLLASMGDAAGGALLDALVEAKTRDARRGLLDRLAKIGPSIAPLVVNKLKSDQRWFVQRNMLTVLREAGCPLDQVPLDLLVNHADARVRREATHLQFQNPAERDRALLAALRDSDASMIKIGLKAARTALPEAAVPILAKRVLDPAFPPEFRTSALQLLARSSSVLALESLLRYVSGGTTLLGKPKLAAKTPEMMIALSGLARTWPNERRAAPLIALARESKDRDIVAAAMPGPKPATPVKDALDDD